VNRDYQYGTALARILREQQEYEYSPLLTPLVGSTLHKTEVTEERLLTCMYEIRKKIAFYRVYPDLFIDDLKGPDCVFKFYTYQRVFLRAVMRHRYVYATFPRAYSKSFLTMMSLMIKCILYPNLQCSVTTGGKEQAASITIAKIEEICRMIPALANEIDWSRGASKKSRDTVKYIFKNGSYIDILAAKESSRGQRRNAIVIEESILMDGDILHEIIVPTTNVDRYLPDGTRDPKEMANKSQVFITTAGWKGTFPYDQMIDTLINAVIDPEQYCVMGGTFDTPVKEGLLEEDFVTKLMLEGTFNESSFDREYRSVWAGDSEGCYYSSEAFDKCRVLNLPEWEYNEKVKHAYYVLGVDVGRFGCTSEVAVIKVIPQTQGPAIKNCVCFYSMEGADFEDQCIKLKKLFFKYRARSLVIDGNGVGAGLIDFLTKGQVDPETNEELPPFGVEGGNHEEAIEPYRQINKGDNVVKDAIYIIKANLPFNTEAHSYLQAQLVNRKIKFLIDEREAKLKIMETKRGQHMKEEERIGRIQPYVLTSILKEQMMNLKEESDISGGSLNIRLKPIAKKIPKDRFSALEYGLYYVKKQEDGKKRKRINVAKLSLFT
jgi:hypothetical protein